MENQNSNKKMLSRMFTDRESAEQAYKTLHERGYSKEDINLVMTDEARKKHFSDHHHTTELGSKALEGAGTGGAIGGTIGAIVGIIAAIGTSLVIPGLGLVVAGPLAAGLAGAGAGSITGGLVGALVGSGIPEYKAKKYEEGLKNGNIVMGVHPHESDNLTPQEKEWQDETSDVSHH
jgi:hypothetical protein